MPPIAVVEASPLNNKEKIIKMMREQMGQQIPPQVQQQMAKMQHEMQKLAQENQALKTSQQEAMAKIDAQLKEGMAKIAVNKEIREAEIMVEAQTNVDEAIATVKNLIQQHETKVASMIQVAMTKQEAAREVNNAKMETKVADMVSSVAETMEGAEVVGVDVETSEPDAMAPVLEAISMQHQQFMEAMGAMMASLQAKKNIQILRNPQTGRIDGAQVVTQ